MKQLFMTIILLTLLLVAFNNRILAAVPDLPAIPQDEDLLCADVNEDGAVNVLDIISVINFIMGGNPSPFNQEAADINADELINILDVISMVNIILQVQGLPCGCVAPVTLQGKTYSTVQIGSQCWFRENMDVGIMIAGTIEQSDNGTIEKYCFDNLTSNCGTYGGLYEWNEAMQYVTDEGTQGICPAGWHVPSDGEWKVLEGTVDSQFPVGDPEWNGVGARGYDAGGNMKEAGMLHWYAPNAGATNSSGFTALPGGYRDYFNGNSLYIHEFGYYWSSSQMDANGAWDRYLSTGTAEAYRMGVGKQNGFSVRCLKGCWPQPTQANAGPDQLNLAGTSTTLAGNTPSYGTGLWTIVSGTGGNLVNPASPSSQFQGEAGTEYTLSWTITTACGSSTDQVVISFEEAEGFLCGDILIDDRDGQSYPTVLIDAQCWMAGNLNVGTRINSTAGGFQQTDNDIIEKYCYNNDPAQCDVYGGLYEWSEAMQYVTTEGAQGACPAGWHIPSDGEYTTLVDFLGGSSIAGGKMKETGLDHWDPPNEGATNESGFTGLPGGHRSRENGNFHFRGRDGNFWSSTVSASNSAWLRRLNAANTVIGRGVYYWDIGYSVRCMKD
jgi:uncharacterized protein (TIGR02145 family)